MVTCDRLPVKLSLSADSWIAVVEWVPRLTWKTNTGLVNNETNDSRRNSSVLQVRPVAVSMGNNGSALWSTYPKPLDG